VRVSYGWLVLFVVAWPAIGKLLTLYTPASVPAESMTAVLLGFGLIGLATGYLLLRLVRNSADRVRRLGVVFAYLLLAPVAGFSALLGPIGISWKWMVPVTTAVYGIAPLALGIAFALWIARSVAEEG
jgi:hypothetical protein